MPNIVPEWMATEFLEDIKRGEMQSWTADHGGLQKADRSLGKKPDSYSYSLIVNQGSNSLPMNLTCTYNYTRHLFSLSLFLPFLVRSRDPNFANCEHCRYTRRYPPSFTRCGIKKRVFARANPKSIKFRGVSMVTFLHCSLS